MRRPEELDFRASLSRLMERAVPETVEANASRQERTVDAVLNRLFYVESEQRREFTLLADEVGLGKTFVALGVAWSVLVERKRSGLPSRPVLVVTPNAHALFRKWQREAETFFQQSVPDTMRFEVEAVETPHALVQALKRRQPKLILARMSAFEGQLYKYDAVMASALHGLFQFSEPFLSVDQRLALVGDWSILKCRESVNLKRSRSYWEAAEALPEAGFSGRHIKRAIRRLQQTDPKLMARIRKRFEQAKCGDAVTGDLAGDVREVARAALGERVIGDIPLVIVDEIHNWKNHPRSWQRFLHTLGGKVERLLGLSATPFQLGSYELIRVLGLRVCLTMDAARRSEMDSCVDHLQVDLGRAHDAGSRLREAWSEISAVDSDDIKAAWEDRAQPALAHAKLSPRLRRAFDAAVEVERAHTQLMGSLRPFLVRHCRDASHRHWLVGRDATANLTHGSRLASLSWRPGIDVSGDAELVHYLMMRAVQEDKEGRGATSLGADLGGSYDFFRGSELKRLQAGARPSAKPYLDLVELATRAEGGHEHPKVLITAERAFQAWLHGEKTLVFCFNVRTVDAVRKAVLQRVHAHEARVLCSAFDCVDTEYPKRLENFQGRLYNYRQSVFLLFQDHPLAGPAGRVPATLAIAFDDLDAIANKLALGGPPRDRSRFDRRRVLAAAEQVLVSRWRQTPEGRGWLTEALVAVGGEDERQSFIEAVVASDWPSIRRVMVEGVQREVEAEPFVDEDESDLLQDAATQEDVVAWIEILVGQAGRAVLAPYMDSKEEIPSLLTRWHAASLGALPIVQRALATRMLRRMVRSPGFLARFLLDDPNDRPALSTADEESDGHWSSLLHRRWHTPPAGGESAKDRFEGYLETLRKIAGRAAHFAAYEDASRNREMVAKVTGSMSNLERDRHFTGFNTPLVPEVLIVTTVGQEGIDLHRECRHVIHHDLPWNPATLEQRTGRVDRIGSKAERLLTPEWPRGRLDVVVPYIANTYDEYRFRRVHARSHLFEVTMGGEYVVETPRHVREDDPSAHVVDDINVQDQGNASVPLPDIIAHALRMKLEA